MFLILFAVLLDDINHKYLVSDKWKSFCERHLIDWDRSDEQTRRYLEELENKQRDEGEKNSERGD